MSVSRSVAPSMRDKRNPARCPRGSRLSSSHDIESDGAPFIARAQASSETVSQYGCVVKRTSEFGAGRASSGFETGAALQRASDSDAYRATSKDGGTVGRSLRWRIPLEVYDTPSRSASKRRVRRPMWVSGPSQRASIRENSALPLDGETVSLPCEHSALEVCDGQTLLGQLFAHLFGLVTGSAIKDRLTLHHVKLCKA